MSAGLNPSNLKEPVEADSSATMEDLKFKVLLINIRKSGVGPMQLYAGNSQYLRSASTRPIAVLPRSRNINDYNHVRQ